MVRIGSLARPTPTKSFPSASGRGTRTCAPAFYSYTAPEPQGLTDEALRPEGAFWTPEGGTALLMYDDLRGKPSPKTALLEFMQSAYLAGAKTAGWDLEAFRTGPGC